MGDVIRGLLSCDSAKNGSYGHPKWDEENDCLAGIYGAVQDITERKQVDIELQQRAEEVLFSGDDSQPIRI